MKRGYSGRVIVSEGDSWFQYPVLLRHVIDNLMDSFAVMSLGAAGDTLSNTQAQREYRSAIAETNAGVFCFSASGNDVLGGGDLVRRVAPMWGSEADARMATADTFHYTVCAPQHARLKQRIWLEPEDYLLDWAEAHSARHSIFTGPVFRADDPLYRGLVKVPADYWKIAVAATGDGLRAVGYLHSQKNLIPSVEEAFGDYKTHRVPVHVIGELTGLDVSAFGDFDVAGGGFEMDAEPRLVQGREDIGFV